MVSLLVNSVIIVSNDCFLCWLNCYKVMQDFTVTDLFAGQHNTKLHVTITDVKYTIVGSALLRD